MNNIHRVSDSKRMSNVVKYNGLLFLAGQVATDVSADIRGQTRQVLLKVDELLAAHGSGKDRILSCQIFLSDLRFFSAMNEVWDDWVPQNGAPARATVEARLASPEKLIEICIIAAEG